MGRSLVIDDGVNIAKEIELPDPFENMGVQMVKKPPAKPTMPAATVTTSTILAATIINEGFKNIAAG